MTVVNNKLDTIRTTLFSSLTTTITNIATGTSATAPTVGDTALGGETIREVLFDTTPIVSSRIGFIMFQDVADNNGNNIQEAGTFDAASGGNMYSRSLTNLIAKSATIEVTIQINFILNLINI